MSETVTAQQPTAPSWLPPGFHLVVKCQHCGRALLKEWHGSELIASHERDPHCKLSGARFCFEQRLLSSADAYGAREAFVSEHFPHSFPARDVDGGPMSLALMVELLFAARDLVNCNLLDSARYGWLPSGAESTQGQGQVCSICAMHSRGGKLNHLDSCRAGRVARVIDRILGGVTAPQAGDAQAAPAAPGSQANHQANSPAPEATPGRRKEDVPAVESACARDGNPVRGEYGEPWSPWEWPSGAKERAMLRDRNALVAQAAQHLDTGSRERIGERIAACVNFCEGIDTGILQNQLPLASSRRLRFHEIQHLRRALPWLPALADEPQDGSGSGEEVRR